MKFLINIGIVSEGIEKYKFTQKPSELYDPINYIISHGEEIASDDGNDGM